MLRRLLGEDIQISAVLNDHLGIVEAETPADPAGAGEPHGQRPRRHAGGRPSRRRDGQRGDRRRVREHASEIAPGNYASLSVTDTGTGMSEEVAVRTFSSRSSPPSRRAAEPGWGWPPATDRQAERGHIWVHSELGQGTTVDDSAAPGSDPAGWRRSSLRGSTPGARHRDRPRRRGRAERASPSRSSASGPMGTCPGGRQRGRGVAHPISSFLLLSPVSVVFFFVFLFFCFFFSFFLVFFFAFLIFFFFLLLFLSP